MLEVRYIYHFDQKPVTEYTLKNGRIQISVLDLGAQITKIIVPNKNDKLENITLRYLDYKLYKLNKYNLGCLVDINKFILNKDYVVNNHFDCEILENKLKFTSCIDNNYICVTYTLKENELIIEYDNNMLLSLGHILYFNLSGNIKQNIKGHIFKCNNNIINLNEDIKYFSLISDNYDIYEDKIFIQLFLPKNGINLLVNNLKPQIYYSFGKYFNKEFMINKGKVAEEYLGIGILLATKNNSMITMRFN